MWFGTAGAGLMRFDRAANRFVSYEHDPSDEDSIGHDRVIALFEDREANIWIGLHQAEPNFFREKPLPFENLTRGSSCKDGEISGLVSSIYQDSQGYLWLAANRRLQRINRKTGECVSVKEADNSEVLSIAEDTRDVLWLGNAPPGLLRYDLKTGKRTGYSHNSAVHPQHFAAASLITYSSIRRVNSGLQHGMAFANSTPPGSASRDTSPIPTREA